jgi:DnaJ family protein C protein 17
MFRQISVAVEMLSDPSKRSYLDQRLESDRKKKQKYAEMDKKRKEMVDALVAREEDAKRAKVAQTEMRKQAAEEESIKERGREMLEQAQKRAAKLQAEALADAKAKASAQSQAAHDSAQNGQANVTNGANYTTQPPITPIDLTLVLQFPSSSTLASTSASLQAVLAAKYGSISHLILKEPAPPVESAPVKKKKGKDKGKKAVVEFERGNWGGCWACWKDHQDTNDQGRSVEVGVKAKWAKGEEPAWVSWANNQTNGSSQTFQPTVNPPAANGKTNGHVSLGTSGPESGTGPSFGSAPDLGGGTSMADLLAQHGKKRQQEQDEKQSRQDFESMTLLRMRQLEREWLEEQIRREEEDEG